MVQIHRKEVSFFAIEFFHRVLLLFLFNSKASFTEFSTSCSYSKLFFTSLCWTLEIIWSRFLKVYETHLLEAGDSINSITEGYSSVSIGCDSFKSFSRIQVAVSFFQVNLIYDLLLSCSPE